MNGGTAAARARLLASGGKELVERLDHLEAHRAARPASGSTSAGEALPAPPEASTVPDYDVAIVGGGLWSILAPLLGSRGLRVAVLDRARVGAAHREWNASRQELQALVDVGLFSGDELDALVVARYDRGVCRFHRGGVYEVTGVLDHAVDAGALLSRARSLAESQGVHVFDDHALVGHAAGANAVRMRFEDRSGGKRELTARVMVDARGATSPYATADLVCPTVGGVVRGLVPGDAPDEMNPQVGDILATIDPIEDGRQHVWEAFPGRAGETTVYLFHYARATEPLRPSLWELYARFFAALPRYKRGDAELVRPTFGFIPGWSRLSPPPASPHPGIVLVGDAASRHSPLTYCGFGATLRSLARAADGIARRVAGEPTTQLAVDDRPVHALTGLLAHVMASRRFGGHELNGLLDAAFASLHAMGNDAYASLLRDEMSTADFIAFMSQTARRHPGVWTKAFRGLGPVTLGRWGLGLAKQAFAEA